MPVFDKKVEVGQEFSGKPKKISWQRLWAFSGGPFNAEGWPRKNIHTDLTFAQSTGLSRVYASGTQFQGHIVELMLDLFGDRWLTYGEMTNKFVKGVGEGEVITTKARVQAKEETSAGVKYDLEIWCENQDGEKAVVGTAMGLVS